MFDSSTRERLGTVVAVPSTAPVGSIDTVDQATPDDVATQAGG